MIKKFLDVDREYYKSCKNAGTLQRIYYSSNTYDEEAKRIQKDALVYLPHGYEKFEEAYDVFYLMHGGGGNSDEIFGGLEAKTDLKNILDNMIEQKLIKPLIVVAPSFYYEGCTDALTVRKEAAELTQNFHHELMNELIPAIEGNFFTKTGREHRAFGGYSMGAEATWNVFAKCLDEFKYFLPMSGDCWAVKIQGGEHCPKETVDYLENAIMKADKGAEDYRIFICVGDHGVAYQPLNSMVQEMKSRTKSFVFGQGFQKSNVIYCVAEGGEHTYDYCYKYIWNALPYFFKR